MNPEPPPEHKCKHGTIDCEQYIYVARMDLIKALVVADTTSRPTYIAPDAATSSKIIPRSNIFLEILQMIIAQNRRNTGTYINIVLDANGIEDKSLYYSNSSPSLFGSALGSSK